MKDLMFQTDTTIPRSQVPFLHIFGVPTDTFSFLKDAWHWHISRHMWHGQVVRSWFFHLEQYLTKRQATAYQHFETIVFSEEQHNIGTWQKLQSWLPALSVPCMIKSQVSELCGSAVMIFWTHNFAREMCAIHFNLSRSNIQLHPLPSGPRRISSDC